MKQWIGSLFWGQIEKESDCVFSPFLPVYFSIVACFLYLILGPYFKPPWAEDHLVYTLMSSTRTFEHLNYWGGNFSERLSVLYLIRVLVPFFKDPSTASTASVIGLHILLIGLSIYYLHRASGVLSATIGGCFLVFTLIQLRAHGSEVLADPYATFFILAALTAAAKAKIQSAKTDVIYPALAGFFIWWATGAKIHYGAFLPLFAAPLLVRRRYGELWRMLAGFAIGILLFAILFYAFYPPEIRQKYPAFLFKTVILNYVKHGVGADPGPNGAGYVLNWFEWLLDWKYFVLPFVLFPLFGKSYQKGARRNLFVIGSGFVALIFLMSSVSVFQVNHMYPFAAFVYLALGTATLLGESLQEWVRKPEQKISLGILILLSFAGAFFLGFLSEPFDLEAHRSTNVFLGLTLLAGLILTGAFLSAKEPRLLTVALLAFLAVPQTFVLTVHDYRTHVWWRHGYDAYHDLLGRVDTAFLSSGTVLGYFKSLPQNDKNTRYVPTILGTRVFPCADVVASADAKGFRELLEKESAWAFGAIVTDDFSVVEDAEAKGFELRSTQEGDGKLPPIFHLSKRSSH